MKAIWLLPFTFTAGAEGFALFAPYLIFVLTALYVSRRIQAARRSMPAFRFSTANEIQPLPSAQPAL
jgi:hypothetical protein